MLQLLWLYGWRLQFRIGLRLGVDFGIGIWLRQWLVGIFHKQPGGIAVAGYGFLAVGQSIGERFRHHQSYGAADQQHRWIHL